MSVFTMIKLAHEKKVTIIWLTTHVRIEIYSPQLNGKER